MRVSRFWEMLAYLANTLIFMLVGMMITTKAVKNVSDSDWVLTIALYCAVTIIRYGAYYYAGRKLYLSLVFYCKHP